jgi:hypothetical protein
MSGTAKCGNRVRIGHISSSSGQIRPYTIGPAYTLVARSVVCVGLEVEQKVHMLRVIQQNSRVGWGGYEAEGGHKKHHFEKRKDNGSVFSSETISDGTLSSSRRPLAIVQFKYYNVSPGTPKNDQ